MPANKLMIRSNAADFPCDAGRIPDIGFSFTKPNGQPSSASLTFVGSNITEQAKRDTYNAIQDVCLTDKNFGAKGYALNCGSFGAHTVQKCNTLYNCTAPGAVNGTQMGAAQANGVSAHLTFSTKDLSEKAACYADALPQALLNSTNANPPSTSGAASSPKATKTVVAGLLVSAAMLVLAHA